MMPPQRSLLKTNSFRSGVITRKKVRFPDSGSITKKRSCRSRTINKVDDNSNKIMTRSLRARKADETICNTSESLSMAFSSQPDSLPKVKLGFILGEKIFGCQIISNLLRRGHKLTVCLLDFPEEIERKFLLMGAEIVSSPLEVWRETDVIMSYMPTAQHAKELIFGEHSALQELNTTKYFIEMSCIDPDTSYEIDNIMKSRGVIYLEAQIQGNIKDAVSGYLTILTAGDQTLFKMCQSCFEAIGCQSFFFGSIGSACKINLTLRMMTSVCVAGLAQGLALAKYFGFRIDDLLEVICMTNLSSTLIRDKGACMIKGHYPPEMILKQMQRDIVSVKKLAEDVQHPLPVASTVNEKLKECVLLGYGYKDISAVFQAF